MTSLMTKFRSINGCLNCICEVESDLLDTGILGIFKRKNFSNYQERLELACNDLMKLQSSLNDQFGYDADIDLVITDAKEYIVSLLLSTAKLIEINQNLWGKSMGKQYSITSYNRDLTDFKFLQNVYCAKGERMNDNYRLYANKISKL